MGELDTLYSSDSSVGTRVPLFGSRVFLTSESGRTRDGGGGERGDPLGLDPDPFSSPTRSRGSERFEGRLRTVNTDIREWGVFRTKPAPDIV